MKRLLLVMVSSALLAAHGCVLGCAASGRHDPAVLVSTTQPAVVEVSQDLSAVKAEVDAKIAAEVAALRLQLSKTTTYGNDVWFGRTALVLAFFGFVYARWQARKYGYEAGRRRRLTGETESPSPYSRLSECTQCGAELWQPGTGFSCPKCGNVWCRPKIAAKQE